MDLSEYSESDAVRLAELIRERELSAEEVQDAARRAVEEVNPQLNAIVDELFPASLSYSPDGVFAGVPMLLKDICAPAQGVPQQMGSRITGHGLVADYDCELVARFKAAGLAILGRTTTPEFGWSGTTEPVLTGPTRNPWDLETSTSGSSGGSAALVASRAVPIAHANDGGGSIRLPAAWCGLVGLKPSRGRIAEDPDSDESPDFFPVLVQLALTRTVRDTAALLDAVKGGVVGGYWDLPTPPRAYRDEMARPAGPMRIAVTGQGWSPRPVDGQHKSTVDVVGRQLETMGHAVEHASPKFDYEALLDAYVQKCAVDTAHSIDVLAKATGVDPTREVLEATTLDALRLGRELTAYDVYTADAILSATRRAMALFFHEYEVLVTPTMTDPPCRLGEMNADDPTLDIYAWQRIAFSYSPFPWPFNVTGQPAISLPLGETKTGMPIGVQLVGRIGAEATLLKLAAQLEHAMPWATRRPRVSVGATD